MDPALANAIRLLQTGAPREAEAACRALLARNSSNAHAMQVLGVALRQLGHLEEAETNLRRSVELAPRNAEFSTNLAQLLGARDKPEESATEFRRALSIDARFKPALVGLARLAIRTGRYAEAEQHARRIIDADERDGEAWSLFGSALHATGRLAEARSALERATALAPRHGTTRAQLAATLCDEEQAELALAQADEAERLGVAQRALGLVRARALMQLDQYDAAEAVLAPVVAAAPDDTEGQFLLAQLRHVRGDDDFARSFRDAASRAGASPAVRAAYADVMRRSGNTALAEQLLRALMTDVGMRPELLSSFATLLQESGRHAEAMAIARQAADAQPGNVAAAENFAAAALSAGHPDAALPTVERFRGLAPDDQRWITYRADVARQRGEGWFDEWCDLERVVRLYEVKPPPGYANIEEFHTALRPALEARHRQRSHPLDQSLRHGTQTSRGLLADPDPIIRAMLDAMAEPIAAYQAAMSRDTAHPLYARNSAPAYMVGCWSIRLKRGGFHVNHIHPQGWISSAYYVSVPSEVEDTSMRSGWIKFGEPRFPMPHGEAGRFVQPRPGLLVLFPSYLWHGTTPIHGDEPRLTIAFDAVPRHRVRDA